MSNKIISIEAQLTRTKEAFKKNRRIERDMADGNFADFDFFLKYSGKMALNYALEWTSFYGKVDLMNKTLDAGADIDIIGSTALQMSCCNGHLDAVIYLLTKINSSTNIAPAFVEAI